MEERRRTRRRTRAAAALRVNKRVWQELKARRPWELLPTMLRAWASPLVPKEAAEQSVQRSRQRESDGRSTTEDLGTRRAAGGWPTDPRGGE